MLAQSVEDLYFLTTSFAVFPNTFWKRVVYRNKRDLILQLGSGDDHREGMVNVDGNFARKKDMWLDLRNRLPFGQKSAKVIYCCHMLEHLLPEDALPLLREMHRVLSDDGILRLAVPSFERCLDIVAGRETSHWPRELKGERSQAINYLFCDGQYKYAYCFENLSQFAEQAGFTRIHHCSELDGLVEKDYSGIMLGKENPGSLVVELQR